MNLRLNRQDLIAALPLAIAAVLILVSAWVFLDLIEDVATQDPLVMADLATYHFLQDHRTPLPDTLMIALTELGDSVVAGCVAGAVGLWLLWKKAWRSALCWLFAVSIGSMLNTVIKVALHRARPAELYAPGWSAWSFPSGHSTVNAILYGFLAVMLVRNLRGAWRIWTIAGLACLVFAIAFSRLYLGAHWLSDVGGGLAFGTFWLTCLSVFYLRVKSDIVEPRQLLAVAMGALVIAGSVHITTSHTADVERYKIRHPEVAAELSRE